MTSAHEFPSLSLNDVGPFTVRESHGALLDMWGWSNGGGLGISSVAHGRELSDGSRWLEEGKKFVEAILKDLDLCENGVPVQAVIERVHYDPRWVLAKARELYFKAGKIDVNSEEAAREKMREVAQKFAGVFATLIAGDETDTDELKKLNEEYRTMLSIPYLHVYQAVERRWYIDVAAPPRF